MVFLLSITSNLENNVGGYLCFYSHQKKNTKEELSLTILLQISKNNQLLKFILFTTAVLKV